jgi:hypothetical protein
MVVVRVRQAAPVAEGVELRLEPGVYPRAASPLQAKAAALPMAAKAALLRELPASEEAPWFSRMALDADSRAEFGFAVLPANHDRTHARIHRDRVTAAAGSASSGRRCLRDTGHCTFADNDKLALLSAPRPQRRCSRNRDYRSARNAAPRRAASPDRRRLRSLRLAVRRPDAMSDKLKLRPCRTARAQRRCAAGRAGSQTSPCPARLPWAS